MAWSKLNLFVAWVLIPQTLAMGWIAAVGQFVLEVLGHELNVEALPCRMIGVLLVIMVVFLVQYYRPIITALGDAARPTYRIGHRFILASNVLAALLFIYPFFTYLQLITHPDLIMIMSKFAVAFGYMAIGGWALGFPLVYQSGQPDEAVPSE